MAVTKTKYATSYNEEDNIEASKEMEVNDSKDKASSDNFEKFILRLPKGMRDKIQHESKLSYRSMNSEIIHRLDESFTNDSAPMTDQNLKKLFLQLYTQFLNSPPSGRDNHESTPLTDKELILVAAFRKFPEEIQESILKFLTY